MPSEMAPVSSGNCLTRFSIVRSSSGVQPSCSVRSRERVVQRRYFGEFLHQLCQGAHRLRQEPRCSASHMAARKRGYAKARITLDWRAPRAPCTSSRV